MDFTLTEEQKAIQMLARDFAREEVEPVAAERDRLTLHVVVEQVHHPIENGR